MMARCYLFRAGGRRHPKEQLLCRVEISAILSQNRYTMVNIHMCPWVRGGEGRGPKGAGGGGGAPTQVRTET
jgi:hypothetical protein